MEIQSEMFCLCIGFISEKYRVSQKFAKKMENTILLIFISYYAKRHINVCSEGDLCSRFLAIFLRHPV